MIFLLTWFHAGVLLGQQHKLEGNLNVWYYINGEFDKALETRFWMEINGSQYNLRTTLPGSTNYVEWGCDGRDLYRLVVAPAQNAGVAPKRPPAAPLYPVFIAAAEGVPPDDGSLNQYVWLAYASQNYFRSLVTNRIEPVWNLDDPALRANHFTCAAQIQTDAAGLPLEVIYLSDGVYRGLDGTKNLPITRNLPPPYDKGFTNAVFQRISSRLVDGTQVPDVFRFTLYATPIAAPVPLLLRLVVEGRLTSSTVVSTADPDLRPQFQGRASVWDSRVTGVVSVPNVTNIPYSYAGYRVTNGFWLDSNKLNAIRPKYEAFLLRDYKRQSKGIHSRRVAAYGTLVTMAVLSLGFALALWKWAAIKHENEQTPP